ncbi:carbohydrate ABC transporter permease [Ruminiclostridium cellobioparum]|uniref:ABC transporter, permease protein n=1 Tax=Ruminiclostridium cellobioparum subsp. termitidis CT1112 TaxID=1195236 RepID=S0FQG2_RUMCE|nr:sugar ABC transporter permease [Ruminiclostridium cellobioparum]EMS70723.1 ABC transporter, permease protein [Ruminiclostridium cellobioparum subsp. termitidis CT1112]
MKIKAATTSKKKRYIGLLYISPWIIGFLVFQLYPFVSSFVYSFTDYSITNTPSFLGFKNYISMFKNDDLFYQSLGITIKYVFMSVPMKLAFALLVAMLLNIKLKFVNVFRTVYYLPSILGGSVAVAVLWKFLFMKEGVVNKVLSVLHIPSVDWLGNPSVALFTIGLLTVWQFGSSMVLFLAGLKQIPAELYEAGTVDGASKIRMFFTITIPLLTPIIFFNLIMQMVNAFQDFTGPFVITGGGPLNSTYLYAMKLYDEGFKFYKMGYASALSWILFLLILAFTALTFKSSQSWTHYEDGGDF